MIKEKSKYSIFVDGGRMTVVINGEVDHHNAIGLRADLDREIYSHRPEELIFDLSAVEFMDSSGLGLILGRFATVKEIGGTLTVKDPNIKVEKILKLAGLERIVKVEYTK